MKPPCLDCSHRMGHSCYRHGYVENVIDGRLIPLRITSCRDERCKQNVIARFLSAIGFAPTKCGRRGRYFKARIREKC
jgi:hypothetical protein